MMDVMDMMDMMDMIDDHDEPILDIVRGLGPQLTHSDHELRLEGLLILERKILRTPAANFHPEEVTSLIEFLNAKLDDHHSLCASCLRCLRYLTTSPHLSYDDAARICRTIFSEIQTQALNQLERQTVFSIFANVLSKFCNQLAEDLSHDFVFGFIQAMEGEKDPRNLIIVFRLAETVIKHFNIERFTEDFFEIISCYYPVVFVPPANDTRGITRDQLVKLNRACLVASPAFAPFLLPLLLEKLQESGAQTRLEALQTLVDAIPTYSLADLQMYEKSLIDCLQKEISRETSPEIITAVHENGINLVQVFSACDGGGDASPLQQFLDNLFKAFSESLGRHVEPELDACGKFMLAIARTNTSALQHLTLRSLPFLLDLQKNEAFIRAILDLSRAMSSTGHTDSLHGLEAAGEDPEAAFPSVRLLLRLLLIPDFLSEERAKSILERAQKQLSESEDQSERCDMIKVLAEFASSSTRKDAMEVSESTSLRDEYFEGWKKALIGNTASFREMSLEILQSCAKLSEKKCLHLVQWLLESILSNSEYNSCLTRLLSAIVCDSEEESAVASIGSHVVAFLKGLTAAQWEQLDEGLKPCLLHLTQLGGSETQNDILNVCRFHVSIEENTKPESVNLLCSVICSLSPEMAQRCAQPDFLDSLFSLSASREASAHAYASLLNKAGGSEEVFAAFSRHLSSLTWSSATGGQHLWLVLCARALLERNHPEGVRLLGQVLNLLEADRFELASWTAARAAILLQPLPDTFHNGVSFSLVAQKTFVLVQQHLVSRYAAIAEDRHDLLVEAQVGIIAHLPLQVIQQHVDMVLPLLVRGLMLSTRPGCPEAALQSLQLLCEMPEVAVAVAGRVDDFLPAILAMTQSGAAPMDCRIGASRLLKTCLPNLDTSARRLHRGTILRHLARAANDRKRLVRKEAADARNLWLVTAGMEGSLM